MSNPSEMNLPVHLALSSDMMLGLKPACPKSRTYRLSVPPLNASTFKSGEQIILELPTGRRGTWLDQTQSYLKFTVNFSSTAASAATKGGTGIFLDNSAYSFFQRLDIYNSSNLLETINEYGQLCNFLLDTSLTQSDKAGLSTMLGTNSVQRVNAFAQAAGAVVVGSLCPTVQTPGDRSGMACASAQAAYTGIGYTFSLPLNSAVIGVNASKMLPLGKITAPIRIELYLAQNDDAIYYGTAAAGATWQISNVEFVACYVEIQDESFDYSQPGMIEYISSQTYRHSSSYLAGTTSNDITVLLPFRCASLNALYARFRPNGGAVQGVNATACYRKGSSVNPNIANYTFRIGSAMYPNKPVYLMNSTSCGTGGEGYAELLKSFHALSSSIGNSSITDSMYNVCSNALLGWSAYSGPAAKNTQIVPDSHNNAFCIGLETQTISNRNDTILSGISTLNSQVFFCASISGFAGGADATAAASVNYTCDFFSMMDVILCLENGVLSAKF